MITTEEARRKIFAAIRRFPSESVRLETSVGRILHQKVVAERDQPPFDRVTMDGIAIACAALDDGQRWFRIAGTQHAGDAVRALDGNGVRFHGFVESLEPWLDSCRLAVAPLRYGAGIKGKVNQSMAHGQPVVATPMAIEGMFAEPGRDVLVAETPEDFADAVVRLYQDEDLWNRVSAAGQENVNRYFSTETARLGLQELLTSL